MTEETGGSLLPTRTFDVRRTDGRARRGMLCLTLGLASALLLALCATANASPEVNDWGIVHLGGNGEGHEEQPAPTEVPGLENVSSIDQSNATGYALEAGGVVKAWGDGAEGALGDGSEEDASTAVTVNLPAGVEAVSLGEADKSGLAVTSTGHVFVWGMDEKKELCLTGPNHRVILTPKEIPGLSEVVAVQGAAEHTLFLMKNGTVRTCGSNEYGELGLGTTAEGIAGPVEIPGIEHAVEISAGSNVSAVRLANGTVLDFGANVKGELGLGKGSPSTVDTPTKVPLPGPASAISVGGNSSTNTHVLAMVQGVPYGWGVDSGGAIGDGSTEPKFTPVVASELLSYGFSSVIASGYSSYGLAGGELYAWGKNSRGSLGVPGLTSSLVALPIDTGVAEVSGTASEASDLH